MRKQCEQLIEAWMFIGLLQCNCTFTKWKGKLVHDMKEKVFAIILSLALILTMAPMEVFGDTAGQLSSGRICISNKIDIRNRA